MTIRFLLSRCDAAPRSLRATGICTLLLSGLSLPLHAQSATNWLSAAPVPTHALLFGAVASSTPALSPSSSSSSLSSFDPAAAVQPGNEVLLPEAPDPQLANTPKPKQGTDPSEKIAQRRTMTIPSDWHAQRLTARQKVNAGLQDLYSVESVGSWFLAAGWEQLLNGAPNYGTDKGAFGERLGAAALRGTSQNLFSEVILAPLLHEDARYYVEGPKYGLIHRTVYSVTRPFITRNDEGKSTINGALLLGYAGSAALTPTYYPTINRNFKDVASVYGGGIGGAALGFFISEFSQDAFRALHLSRTP